MTPCQVVYHVTYEEKEGHAAETVGISGFERMF